MNFLVRTSVRFFKVIASGMATLILLNSAHGWAASPQLSGQDNTPNTPQAEELKSALNYRSTILSHPTPYIPPQCYTSSKTQKGVTNNPCYTCHTQGKRPNVLNDSETQLAFTFLGPAQTNPWTNLFVDRRAQIAAMSDAAILQYVKQDNYRDASGKVKLITTINAHIKTYDANGNGQWDGYLPDVYFQFDHEGFDRSPSGEYSGWRSFAYYPFLGTFMPTNGSTDDVMIRLPRAFQTNEQGQWDKSIYIINLAIVEAVIKEKNIPIPPVDEKSLGVDLNKNGKLDRATEVVYDWAPLQKRLMSYVGGARELLATKKVHLAAKLYPEGTEFLHSVRYLDINSQQQVAMAPRLKELRYSRKKFWATYFDHQTIAGNEIKERHDYPDRPKRIIGSPEEGITLEQGWVYQGFIEDAQGELRPQTFEEHAFCAGCHSGTGSHVDSSFAFYRKFDHQQFQQGWYHWTQKPLAGIPEPKRESDGEYEYSYYLQHNPTGDEYAANTEVVERFFNSDGKQKPEAFQRLHQDISYLLMPSTARALALNKAYRLIVQEQSFNRGRDAVLAPMTQVHKHLEEDQETGIQSALNFF